MSARRRVPLPQRAVNGVPVPGRDDPLARFRLAVAMLWGALLVGALAASYLETGWRSDPGNGPRTLLYLRS